MEENTVETPLTEQEKAQGYTITKWNGYDHFECCHQFYDKKHNEAAPARCSYSTIWIGKMKDHIATDNHPWGRPDGPYIPRPSTVAVEEKLSEY